MKFHRYFAVRTVIDKHFPNVIENRGKNTVHANIKDNIKVFLSDEHGYLKFMTIKDNCNLGIITSLTHKFSKNEWIQISVAEVVDIIEEKIEEILLIGRMELNINYSLSSIDLINQNKHKIHQYYVAIFTNKVKIKFTRVEREDKNIKLYQRGDLVKILKDDKNKKEFIKIFTYNNFKVNLLH